MNEPLVRGYWLTSAVKFLHAHYAPETSERLLGSMSKPFKSLLPNITPVQWYPRLHHVDVLRVIAGAQRDEATARESLFAYGQATGTDLASGSLRPVFTVLTPRLLAKKLPELWMIAHQDDGVLESDIAEVDEGRLTLRLANIQGYEHIGPATLGWVKGLFAALGRQNLVVQQTGWSMAAPAPSEVNAEVRWS